MTPTQIVDAQISIPYSTPQVGVITDGKYYDDDVNECDRDGAFNAGYRWILHLQATERTSTPFFAEIFIPGSAASISSLVVGNPSTQRAFYYSPRVLPQLPAASRPSGAPPTGRLPLGTTTPFAELYSDARWDIRVDSIQTVPTSRFNSDAGRCQVVTGIVTPTVLDEGTISSPYTTPEFGIIIDGRRYDHTAADCDTSQLESQGFGWILNAEVTAGTPYRFYAEFFIPEGHDGNVQAISVGRSWDETGNYYAGS